MLAWRERQLPRSRLSERSRSDFIENSGIKEKGAGRPVLPAPSDVLEDDGGLFCSAEVAVVARDDFVHVACDALTSEIACPADGVIVILRFALQS